MRSTSPDNDVEERVRQTGGKIGEEQEGEDGGVEKESEEREEEQDEGDEEEEEGEVEGETKADCASVVNAVRNDWFAEDGRSREMVADLPDVWCARNWRLQSCVLGTFGDSDADPRVLDGFSKGRCSICCGMIYGVLCLTAGREDAHWGCLRLLEGDVAADRYVSLSALEPSDGGASN